MDWQTLLISAGVGMATALLTGKAIRRLAMLPFEWIARKTSNKIDDKLVEEAEKDLGITDSTIPPETK